MARNIILITFTIIFCGCYTAYVTRFGNNYYPPTNEVKVYSDLKTIPEDYVEIGFVESNGGHEVPKLTLLNDMKAEAKKYGADALIKIEYYERKIYDNDNSNYKKPVIKAIMIRFKSHMPSPPSPAMHRSN